MVIKFQSLSMGYWMIFHFVVRIALINFEQNEFPFFRSSLYLRKISVSGGYFQYVRKDYISTFAKNLLLFTVLGTLAMIKFLYSFSFH
jgi:hypothetical protein